MIKYNLRLGDLIISSNPLCQVSLLTKKTRSYWYYFCKGKSCRIRKKKLWNAIDTRRDITVKYGSVMQGRKKKRKGRILDLHGTTHEDAREKVRTFLNFIELPCEIITGNSQKMKNLVKEIIQKEYEWVVSEACSPNRGLLTIRAKKY